MEDNNTNTPAKHEDPSVTLTIRLIMQGKEVGSIIGKKGEIVNRFREESGAKINISDSSCPERIVTVSGTTSAIYSAFALITKKFEEWCSQFNNDVGKGGKSQIPIRLIVPASQCGSLIGKSGSKIKEIRQTTGCAIQVAGEMLPNSTERAVTLSGTAEQITQCIYQICLVMLESPPRGATIPYRPKPQVTGPVILAANGQAYTIQGNYALPAQETCPVFPLALATSGLHAGMSSLADPLFKGAHLTGAVSAHHQLQHISDVAKTPLASLAALGLAGMAPANTGGLNPTALAALAGSQLRTNTNRAQQQQHEMTVSNDLIGCIIGKGGTKIAEIRQISGAMIRISNCEEREGGNTDRTITISGSPDSVALAQYLINMSVELQKANLQEPNNVAAALSSLTGIANSATTPNVSNSLATNSLLTTLTNTSNNINSNTKTNLTNNCNSNSNSTGTINNSMNSSSNITTGSNSTSPSNSSLTNNLQTLTSSTSGTSSSCSSSTTSCTLTNNGNQTAIHNSSNLSNNNPSDIKPNPASLLQHTNHLATTVAASSLAQLLAKPVALNALSALGGLTEILGGLASLNGPPVQTTGVHRTKNHHTHHHSSTSSRFRNTNTDFTSEMEKPRHKFNPY